MGAYFDEELGSNKRKQSVVINSPLDLKYNLRETPVKQINGRPRVNSVVDYKDSHSKGLNFLRPGKLGSFHRARSSSLTFDVKSPIVNKELASSIG